MPVIYIKQDIYKQLVRITDNIEATEPKDYVDTVLRKDLELDVKRTK